MLRFPHTDRQARMLALAAPLLPRIAARADVHDRAGTLALESFAELRSVGYQALPVPERFGGHGADLLETVLAQVQLAKADGSTALTMNMHLSTIGTAGTSGAWPEAAYERVCRAVAAGGMVNSAASEPELGSPASGGRPATTVRAVTGGYRIDGRKTWVSGCETLAYYLVPATFAGEAEPPFVGTFLVSADRPGIRIERTWDTMGMRGTGSDDVEFDGVVVPEEALLVKRRLGEADPRAAAGAGWGPCLVAAVYLGIAEAARDEAVDFACSRTPTALGGKSIATLPAVQYKTADMEIALLAARTLLFNAAEEWSACPERRAELAPQIGAVKVMVMEQAVRAVDLAMRIVGGVAMFRSSPLQRYYRDVRAGLNNPPLEERAKEALARSVYASLRPASG
jgi:alkylation response protein AidB-like acyl-CoA dehydrogenase